MSYRTKGHTASYTVPLARSNRTSPEKFRKAQLVVLNAPEHLKVQKLFPITGPMILGRKDTADIFVDDAKLSRLHAQIHFDGRFYFIKDLNSTNGTKVNGKLITEKRIFPKDIIEVGDIKLEFNYPHLVSKTKKQPKKTVSFLTTCFNIVKFMALTAIFVFCLALIYFSATQPFQVQKRLPQSVKMNSTDLSQTNNWNQTQANLYYDMATQAYHEGDYKKAKHFWNEAQSFNTIDSKNKLGQAIEEAIVFKTLYIDHLKTDKERKKEQETIEHLVRSAKDSVRKKEWDQAIIDLQEVLLLDPENLQAKHGMANIEHFRYKYWKTPVSAPKQSETLKAYNKIQRLVERAETLKASNKLSGALITYRKALSTAQENELNFSDIARALDEIETTLTEQTNSLWQNTQVFIEAEKYVDAHLAIKKLLTMNPTFSPALKKQKTVKNIIVRKARMLYSQAIIFETLPDLEAAKMQWNSILSMLSPSDTYYKKAHKKLSKYVSF